MAEFAETMLQVLVAYYYCTSTTAPVYSHYTTTAQLGGCRSSSCVKCAGCSYSYRLTVGVTTVTLKMGVVRRQSAAAVLRTPPRNAVSIRRQKTQNTGPKI
jgi:hypothetical protein